MCASAALLRYGDMLRRGGMKSSWQRGRGSRISGITGFSIGGCIRRPEPAKNGRPGLW